MSDILTHIRARRSIRKFTAEPVSEEDIRRLLEAAMAAPSATNRRPWEFVVLTGEDRLRALRNRLPLGRYKAPLAIVVCGNLLRTVPLARDFWVQDCSAAIQNILLAAAGLGLGGVWIGIHPLRPLIAVVRRLLDLPRHVVPLGAVYVGRPGESKAPRSQYDAQRVHRERWNRRQDEEENR